MATGPGLACLAAAALLCAGCGGAATKPTGDIHKIRHVVIIMQENRSFDSYFGTYPGADGIPAKNGKFTVCMPDPKTGGCVKPFHDTTLINVGGRHELPDAIVDIDGGRMDGFLRSSGSLSAMGYHDAREIANYWDYAKNFVLDDHMFSSVESWSLPAHLYLVSGWSATCSKFGDPNSCKTQLGKDKKFPYRRFIPHGIALRAGKKVASCFRQHHVHVKAGVPLRKQEQGHLHFASIAVVCTQPFLDNKLIYLNFAWTDMTYLLYKHKVSWGYFIHQGLQPDCIEGGFEGFCPQLPQRLNTPSEWNPLPSFTTVRKDHQLKNVQDTSQFLKDAREGTLPSVSWVIPDQKHSEHFPGNIRTGQSYVTDLVNTLMKGPEWDSTAIFVSWDDWGGFYDNVVPPRVDAEGYGLRVPGLVISPYAKRGFIDHQTLSFDAFNKFIEDDFLGGAALDPRTDKRPDPRPDVRENAKILGDLRLDFDFNQKPRPPLLLPRSPPPGAASRPGG